MPKPTLSAALSSLVTAAAAISAARPTILTDGVDITTWTQGGFVSRFANIVLQADGADRTIADPTSGTAGAEIWIWKKDRAGTKRWFLVGSLNATNDIALKNPGGYVQLVELPPGGERLFVAGTPSGGAPTFYAEPVEMYI